MNYAFLAIWIILFSETLVAQNIIRAEYFIDADPGPGNGIMISGIPLDDTVSFPINVSTTGLLPGFHSLGIRVKNDQHQWSHFPVRTFYVNPPASSAPIIVDAEYFVNTDPGILNGEAIAISADDTLSSLLNLDIPQADNIGQFYLAIRMKDASGRWSHFRYDTLTVALSIPSDTIVSATAGSCSRIVNNIDAVTINNEAYTYSLSGATVGSGSGSASGASFNVGITTVTYALVSNPSVDGQFTVTVLDNQLPIITCPDNILQGSADTICGAIVNYIVNFSDNCPNSQLTLLSGINSGSIFPLGTTVNTFRAIDASGNSATCSFTVTISDDDPPTISCPMNVSVNTDPGECSATNVSLGTPLVDDNCAVASTTNNALMEYPVGTTNVIYTVTDVHGFTATCAQSVIVIDNQAPIIICPDNINAFAAPGAQPVVINYPNPVVSDNCAGTTINQTTGLPSGSLFPVGVTTNTFVATDASGTTSSCSFSVTVKVGRVGVNTVSPLAMLHVADSSVLFSGPVTLPSNASPLPTTGSSTRVLWYADKAAWRSGDFDNAVWNKDSIGLYSFAVNYNTTAKGIASAAFGQETVARGDHSAAFGASTVASGKNSISIGGNSVATGEAALAIGSGSMASGYASASINENCISTGDYAFSSGVGSKASGNVSSSFGLNTIARGDQSASFGTHTLSRAFDSFTAGRLNDTTAISTTNWELLDPLFVIGNSPTSFNRRNALTVLKNGDVGIYSKVPLFRLHITNDNVQSGGMNEGVLIENINAAYGEAAISFRINSLPATRKWIIGQNQDQTLTSCYRSSFVIDGMKIRLDTVGFFGITRLLPKAMLHVMRSDSSGGPFSSNALAIFESPFISYLQLSHPDNVGTGILSGNQATAIRSAVYFQADSSIQFTSGGDQIRLTISNNGNFGIADEATDAKLDVAGNNRIGANGTVFQQLIKQTYNLDIPQILPGGYYHHSLAVDNVEEDGTVFISPAVALPSGWILTSQVLGDGVVQLRFNNAGSGMVDPSAMDFYLVHIY